MSIAAAAIHNPERPTTGRSLTTRLLSYRQCMTSFHHNALGVRK